MMKNENLFIFSQRHFSTNKNGKVGCIALGLTLENFNVTNYDAILVNRKYRNSLQMN